MKITVKRRKGMRMTNLLEAKENVKRIYSKYGMYITPAMKFVLALFSIIMINASLGYMSILNNVAIVLMASLACSFLPWGFLIGACALFILGHLYSLSIECAIIAFALFVLMFLLYFRFTPKDALVVLLTPLCFFLKIPYLIPIAMGLIGTPMAIISMSCGIVTHFVIQSVSGGAITITGEEPETASKFRHKLAGLVATTAMIITLVSFALTLALVYVIRRMSIDHSWTVAIITGAVVNVMILLVGDLIFDTSVSLLGVLLGSAVSIGLAKVVQFFTFNMDYSRTEKVQFEDDEYYYYVKAVPKIAVTPTAKTVKKINSSNVQKATEGRMK